MKYATAAEITVNRTNLAKVNGFRPTFDTIDRHATMLFDAVARGRITPEEKHVRMVALTAAYQAKDAAAGR